MYSFEINKCQNKILQIKIATEKTPSITDTIETSSFNRGVLCWGVIEHNKVSKWDKKSVPCSEVTFIMDFTIIISFVFSCIHAVNVFPITGYRIMSRLMKELSLSPSVLVYMHVKGQGCVLEVKCLFVGQDLLDWCVC